MKISCLECLKLGENDTIDSSVRRYHSYRSFAVAS
jgi:hypothetical protein